jgi:hypothetical protein
MNTTDRGLVQRQKEVMKLQDDMIMEIETGLTSLHGKVQARSLIDSHANHCI